MENLIVKYLLCLGAALLAYFEPMIPFILGCFIAVIFDCISAFLLARRVAKKYPEKVSQSKFNSESAKKIIDTVMKISMVVIMAYFIDNSIITFVDIYLANIVSAVFCMIQIVSVLENISSCSDERWAKILQKILVDKTARHLDIDLSVDDLKPNKE